MDYIDLLQFILLGGNEHAYVLFICREAASGGGVPGQKSVPRDGLMSAGLAEPNAVLLAHISKK